VESHYLRQDSWTRLAIAHPRLAKDGVETKALQALRALLADVAFPVAAFW